MISHKHKFIFIHIPKCAGSSIRDFYFDTPNLDWKLPNYDLLHGWCPERKIHLQHATPKDLIETHLISENIWNEYYKFTFVRNPWGRAYSDYLWIMKDSNVKGNFKDFINRSGNFQNVLNNKNSKNYRGDHLVPQSEYFNDPIYKIDFVGRFENLNGDIEKINKKLNIVKSFDVHSKNNVGNKLSHYSKFYTRSYERLVEHVYAQDINTLEYTFKDLKKGFEKIKNFF
mgnify:CR=1 FL=1|tara:strand:- start:3149 stop:3832 length:684 start_codon:yes stop_codon:yes gene_type:complete